MAKKKAIILDLDNTIYPVSSIGEKLFAPLLEMIIKDGKHVKELDDIKVQIMRKPFQGVARQFSFDEALIANGLTILKDLYFDGPMEPFEDYKLVKELPQEKFLVTTGFKKMQEAKVLRLGLKEYFKEINIIDPMVSKQTKKDVFAEILERNQYSASEVLVIGDDPESEIKGARELGIDAVLYDKNDTQQAPEGIPRITNYGGLVKLGFEL